MLSPRTRKRILSAAATASLLVPVLGFANNETQTGPRWIFPGQSLPSDIGYQPLRVGSSGNVDVQVLPRDWFLLRNPHFTYSNAGKDVRQMTEYFGPVLDENNGQLYYRLMSGMILKEAMVQMGMKPHQARQLMTEIESSGRSFDQLPLNEMGPLPTGLSTLVNEWDRPMTRLGILPYLTLPLSIANSQSSFQHFYFGRIEDTQGQKTCATARKVPPIAAVQVKIDERQKKVDQLNQGVQSAISAFEQSTREVLRLTNRVKQQSAEIDQAMGCFAAIKDRVARGAAMPDEECLRRAQGVMVEAKLAGQWDKFVNVNLKNDKGDFNLRQELDVELKRLEARLDGARASLSALQESRDKIQSEQVQNEQKAQKLQQDRQNQTDIERKLDQEAQALNSEYQELQSISHKLDQGVLNQEMSDQKVKEEIDKTPIRNLRMDKIKSQLTLLLENKRKLQANQSTIMTQVEYLSRTMDTNRAQLESSIAQIGDANKGLVQEVAKLEAQVAELNQRYLAASDQYNFSEYVVSVLTRQLITLGKSRDEDFGRLRKEEAASAGYKNEIAKAEKVRDDALPALQTDITALNAQLGNYRDPAKMGWFLEDDCGSRTQFDSLATGIYLSRAPMSNTVSNGNGLVDGGKWGLFNLDFNYFKESIQQGVLLNVPEYLRLSISYMIGNYDAALAQYLDSSTAKCAEMGNGSSFANSVVGLMGSAFSIWNAGSTPEARTQAYCQKSEARTSYVSSLNQFMAFHASVLDRALPQFSKNAPQELIERQAIMALTREMAILTGSQSVSVDATTRREQLVKALIKILAYDYEAAISKTQAQFKDSSKYQFASQAPGATPSANEVAKIAVGSTQVVQNIGVTRLYKAPVARSENEMGQTLSVNDEVRVLPIDPSRPEVSVQAGWVRVQTQKTGETAVWIPAWTISAQALVDEKSREIYDLSDSAKCPVRRIVSGITNFADNDTVVARYLPELSLFATKRPGVWALSAKASAKAAVASTQKIYVACEFFTSAGKLAMDNVAGIYRNFNGVDYANVIAIRIVEVRAEDMGGGVYRYIPVESEGGFVPTWMPQKSTQQPRIILGNQLDAKTWSLKP